MTQTITDRGGYLAIAYDWRTEQDRPVNTRDVLLSKIPSDNYSSLIGTKIERWHENTAIVYHNNRPFTLDTTYWTRTIDEVPQIKPRRGKQYGEAYDWEWLRGSWVRRWEPTP